MLNEKKISICGLESIKMRVNEAYFLRSKLFFLVVLGINNKKNISNVEILHMHMPFSQLKILSIN